MMQDLLSIDVSDEDPECEALAVVLLLKDKVGGDRQLDQNKRACHGLHRGRELEAGEAGM